MNRTAVCRCTGTFSAVFVALAFAGSAVAGGETVFRWVNKPDEGVCDLMLGDAPVLRYVYAFDRSTPQRANETYKVFHHVFGPGTGQVITKGPGGKYTHHRGLFVGWRRTSFDGKSYDFWHCSNGVHLKHEKLLETEGGPQSGTMTALIHWNDPDGRPVIEETRTVSVSKIETDGGPGYGWQIDWSTVLAGKRPEIELDGDRQHAGFQFRARNEVAETNGARYLRPDGQPQNPEAYQVGRGEEYIDAGWFAMTYRLGENRYTVAYFDNPHLPKPSRFSERPYGRFGTFFRTTLKADKPLSMRYRVLVTSGRPPSRQAIQKRYQAFLSELKERSGK